MNFMTYEEFIKERTTIKSQTDSIHVEKKDLNPNLFEFQKDIVRWALAGIGSVPYYAVLMGRRGLGVELKGSYYEQAKNNLVAAEQEHNEHGADTSVRLCCPICGKKLEGTSCPDCGVDL